MRFKLQMRKLVTLLASLLALASACGESAGGGGGEPAARGGGEPQRFAADITPLNRSEVEGTLRMSLADNHLTVDIDARGLEPSTIHAQHIHGVLDGNREASCPVPADDPNADGFVGLDEGKSAYGGDLLALEPFPTVGPSGRLDWNLTLDVDPDELRPLERRVLLLRGGLADLDAKGGADYVPDLPVACAVIRPLESRASERSKG
ncbi:MAG: hypothetical protein H0W36_02860 [Gemmatimonadetes bacterium]|nr:hypothetical protein [Gemmatimonadota bacterium]